MDPTHIYQQVVESIRDDILAGKLTAGESLPSMRQMTKKWQCTTGTIMRAYQELARQGLVISHVGKGTKVANGGQTKGQPSLRKASLFNRSEAFLLEAMTAGYSPDEIEQSVQAALDHWRAYSSQAEEAPPSILRFIGSHDPSLAEIAAQYHKMNPNFTLQLTFTGSLGGLIALVEKKADLAGSHLWDEFTDTYNEAFVRRLLPGQKVALLTLAHRRVGLITPRGNPYAVRDLADLSRRGVRFVNRQSGSGTRVWLDAQLRRAGIAPAEIVGYQDERMTHFEVARAISKDQANAGLGVETAALSFDLDFHFLTLEKYDLVIPAKCWEHEAIQALRDWLQTQEFKSMMEQLGGYDTTHSGTLTWVQ
ncbi:MAG: GntR family transcriptional regulator [Chloroflexi bacterium]|nr:GntR family transcriptional regulator [Chloroflexota bacterium]